MDAFEGVIKMSTTKAEIERNREGKSIHSISREPLQELDLNQVGFQDHTLLLLKNPSEDEPAGLSIRKLQQRLAALETKTAQDISALKAVTRRLEDKHEKLEVKSKELEAKSEELESKNRDLRQGLTELGIISRQGIRKLEVANEEFEEEIQAHRVKIEQGMRKNAGDIREVKVKIAQDIQELKVRNREDIRELEAEHAAKMGEIQGEIQQLKSSNADQYRDLKARYKVLEAAATYGHTVSLRFFVDYARLFVMRQSIPYQAVSGSAKARDLFKQFLRSEARPQKIAVEHGVPGLPKKFRIDPHVETLLLCGGISQDLSKRDCHSSTIKAMAAALESEKPGLISQVNLMGLKSLFQDLFGLSVSAALDRDDFFLTRPLSLPAKVTKKELTRGDK